MLRISQLKLPVEHTEAQLKKKLLKTAHIKEQDLKQFFIRKRSVDGRKNRNFTTYTQLILSLQMKSM